VDFITIAYFLSKLEFVVMPKMKTHSSAKKRFKLTGSGKLKRRRAGLRHILTKKSKKRKTKLGNDAIVHTADEKRMKNLLCK
jgi:large subunit ribosomal protein L35